jgi:DNA repair exonuclease SbcCD ATPase subunit
MCQRESMSNIKMYEDILVETKTKINLVKDEIDEKIQEVEELGQLVVDLIEAQEVMNITGTLAQEEFEGYIEAMVTDALQWVFGPDYSFEMQTEIVRNQPETKLYVVEKGIRLWTKDGAMGGGMLDLISMVLRVVVWSIHEHKTRPVMLLDEPGKNLDRNKIDKFVEMIQKFHEMLGIQFIIVTHDDKIIDMADRAFQVNRYDGTAYVNMVK